MLVLYISYLMDVWIVSAFIYFLDLFGVCLCVCSFVCACIWKPVGNGSLLPSWGSLDQAKVFSKPSR